MKRLLCLSDYNDLKIDYDQYIIASKNFINTIELCESNNMSYVVMENPWKSHNQIYQANGYLQKIKKQIVLYATQLLNEYHSTDYTEKEWNILLGAWLDIFLAVLYEKYMLLKQVEGLTARCDVELINPEDIIAPLDYTDFTDMVYYEDQYNLYIMSQILGEIGGEYKNFTISNSITWKKPPMRILKKTKGYYKVLMYRCALRTIKVLTGVKDKVVLKDVYLPTNFLLQVMAKSRGQIVPYMRDYLRIDRPKLKYVIDVDWRSSPVNISEEKDAFVVLVERLLKKNIPIAYVEDFDYIQKTAKKQYKYAMHPKAVFYVDEGVSSDEIYKNYLMQIRHTDALFCDMQHGGNFGIDSKVCFHHERDIADYLYTWGWQREHDNLCKYKPMPTSKTMGIGKLNLQKKYILYVNYCASKNPIFITPNGLMYPEELEKELLFLQNLSDNIKKQMIVRLFQNGFGWNLSSIFETAIPELRYDSETDYYESMSKAQLVVLSRWSTTILEALVIDKPVIVLRSDLTCDEEAIPDLEELKRVGVLVETWEELAIRLGSIYQSVDEWWSEPERKRVVQKIKEKYIYSPYNAKELWTDELMHFCN